LQLFVINFSIPLFFRRDQSIFDSHCKKFDLLHKQELDFEQIQKEKEEEEEKYL